MIFIQKKRFKPVLAIWLSSLAVLIVGFIIFLWPQESAKVRISRQLDEKKQAIVEARQAASEKSRIQLEEDIASLQSVVNDFVMSQTSSANLAFDISRISKNLKIGAFSLTNTDREAFAQVAGSDDILAKPVNLSFTTSFNTFASFLNALERCRPAIFADTFRITDAPGDAGGQQVDMKLLVLVSDHAKKGKKTTGSEKLAAKQ